MNLTFTRFEQYAHAPSTFDRKTLFKVNLTLDDLELFFCAASTKELLRLGVSPAAAPTIAQGQWRLLLDYLEHRTPLGTECLSFTLDFAQRFRLHYVTERPKYPLNSTF